MNLQYLKNIPSPRRYARGSHEILCSFFECNTSGKMLMPPRWRIHASGETVWSDM